VIVPSRFWGSFVEQYSIGRWFLEQWPERIRPEIDSWPTGVTRNRPSFTLITNRDSFLSFCSFLHHEVTPFVKVGPRQVKIRDGSIDFPGVHFCPRERGERGAHSFSSSLLLLTQHIRPLSILLTRTPSYASRPVFTSSPPLPARSCTRQPPPARPRRTAAPLAPPTTCNTQTHTHTRET
jgi:hypothetical protein